MAIEDTISTAIRELGLEHSVRPLESERAAIVIASACDRFVERSNVRWWWEAVKPGFPMESHSSPNDDGYKLLPIICPGGAAWLFASDDEDLPWPFIPAPLRTLPA